MIVADPDCARSSAAATDLRRTIRGPVGVRWRPTRTQPEGGCACGSVRYRLSSEPLFVHCCHCLNCQRQTGSAFVINLLIEAERVEILAEAPQPVDVPRDDGRVQRIFSPDVHIYTRSKVGWLALPDEAPAFDVYYDPSELWPAASLRRFGAIGRHPSY